jgi:hypothetical protein
MSSTTTKTATNTSITLPPLLPESKMPSEVKAMDLKDQFPGSSPENSNFKDIWLIWDQAWEQGLSGPERLKLLQDCTSASDFVYSAPTTIQRGDAQSLIQYIEQALATMGNTFELKHVRWFENNERCALQWELTDIGTYQTALSGWSYGQFDSEGKLACVADFW